MKLASLLKLFPAVAAAAFLTVTAVDAQQSGQGQGGQGTQGMATEPFPGPTMTDEQRRAMKESFGTVEPAAVDFDVVVGATVPETVTLSPVPEAVVAATPAISGHRYFALPDGRIAVVHPTEPRVVFMLD